MKVAGRCQIACAGGRGTVEQISTRAWRFVSDERGGKLIFSATADQQPTPTIGHSIACCRLLVTARSGNFAFSGTGQPYRNRQ